MLENACKPKFKLLINFMKVNEMELKIRYGTVQDAEKLTPLAIKIFNDTFADNPLNQPEDMDEYISEAFSFEQTRSELADENSIFFIAETDGEMIGYAKLQKHSKEDCISDENPIELQRLYVAHGFHGRGVAAKIMETCFEESKRQNFQTIWLGVWEYNYRAQKFYEKLGFQKVGNHIFMLGKDAQTDLIMEKKLEASATFNS
jgi:ribosomal protein S18 acetylase RimI-like enzyme